MWAEMATNRALEVFGSRSIRRRFRSKIFFVVVVLVRFVRSLYGIELEFYKNDFKLSF